VDVRRNHSVRGQENVVLLAVPVDLQRTQEMNEIPGIVRLNYVGEGWHRRAIQTGHEDLVDILVGLAALEARIVATGREVVGADRIVLAVGESRGGGAIALTMCAMTFPALQFGEECLAVGNALERNGGLWRNRDRRAGFFFSRGGKKNFKKRIEIGALLLEEGFRGRLVVFAKTWGLVIEKFL